MAGSTSRKSTLADQTVFKLFQRGETRGVFQFESSGMQDLLMKMVPDRIEDLIAANAPVSPGTDGVDPDVLCEKTRQKNPCRRCIRLWMRFWPRTYGIMCYQETGYAGV